MSYRLFIADDSEMLCSHLLERVSEIQGVKVVGTAHNVSTAIRLIHKTKPDAVILDIRMPGGSGIDVLESVRAHLPGTKVIMVTNFPYPQYRKRCQEAGADYFYDKYTEFDKLFDTMKDLIQNHHKAPLSRRS